MRELGRSARKLSGKENEDKDIWFERENESKETWEADICPTLFLFIRVGR